MKKKVKYKISIEEKNHTSEEMSILEKYKIDRNEEIMGANFLIIGATLALTLLIYYLGIKENLVIDIINISVEPSIMRFILGIATLIGYWTGFYYFNKKPLTKKYKFEE